MWIDYKKVSCLIKDTANQSKGKDDKVNCVFLDNGALNFLFHGIVYICKGIC